MQNLEVQSEELQCSPSMPQSRTTHCILWSPIDYKDRIGVNFMDWTSQNRPERDQESKTELKEGNKAERASCVEEAQRVE